MSANDLRTINLQTIPDAIRIMNESSKATSLEYHLDFFGFLTLQGYWNLSSTYSLIRFVDNEPAAIILTCTDVAARDAYILYWGKIPKFRIRNIASELVESCCNKLFEDGYHTVYASSLPDRPVRRYRFVQFFAGPKICDMQTTVLHLPDCAPEILVKPVPAAALHELSIPPAETFHWSQRLSFLRHAASRLQFFGAFDNDKMTAYAAVLKVAPDAVTLVDLRSNARDLTPGFELLRHIFLETYSAPFIATNVFEETYNHHLLSAARFTVQRTFHLLARDLRSTCSIPVSPPA